MARVLLQALCSTSRVLADSARGMGTLAIATRGTGKSRLLGRVVAYQDVVRGVPTVVLDPLGGLIDNLLDKLIRLPPSVQREVWPRVRYVNMAGLSGRVIPWPIYYRASPDETFYSVSQRYLDVLRRADPALTTASIQGWNRLAPLATAIGIVLAASGRGIADAELLLSDPHLCSIVCAEAVQRSEEAAPAASYLADFMQLSAGERELRSEPLRNKLALFRFDATTRAMFGATTPGIVWSEVVAQRLCILIDFRDEFDLSRMQFKLLWVFHSLLDYIRRRGNDKGQTPLSVLIDELSYAVGLGSLNTALLTADFEELINRLARNKSVWLTLAAQEQYQLPESIRNTLLSMGNQIYGSTSDLEAALRLSARYFRYDPHLVKKYEPIYDRGAAIDERTVEYARDEQDYLNALQFLDLPRYHFLVAGSRVEGTLPTHLTHISIEQLDQGQYVQDEPVTSRRHQLMERYGILTKTILDAIEARLPGSTTNTRMPIEQASRPRNNGLSDTYTEDDIPDYDEDEEAPESE